MKWIQTPEGHWEEATIPEDIKKRAAEEAKAAAAKERQELLRKSRQLEMERMADSLFSTEVDLRGDGKYRLVRNTANSLALAELLSAYEGAGEKIGNIQEWLKQAVRRHPRLVNELAWERIPPKVTVEQADETLREYCRERHVGYNEAIFKALRRNHPTGFDYDDIDRAVANGAIVFGPQSDEELQAEADELAQVIVGSKNWYVDSDRKHFDTRGRNAALELTRKLPIEILRSQAETIEHNRKLAGLSVSELRTLAQQEREQHQQPTPPTVEIHRKSGAVSFPVLPLTNQNNGEALDDRFFYGLWNNNRAMFHKYCATYGSEQVLARMHDTVTAETELTKILG